MYATPIIYPMSQILEKYQAWIALNPIVHVVEAFKHVFLGAGRVMAGGLLYACGFLLVSSAAGVIIFNRTEQIFMDTV